MYTFVVHDSSPFLLIHLSFVRSVTVGVKIARVSRAEWVISKLDSLEAYSHNSLYPLPFPFRAPTVHMMSSRPSLFTSKLRQSCLHWRKKKQKNCNKSKQHFNIILSSLKGNSLYKEYAFYFIPINFVSSNRIGYTFLVRYIQLGTMVSLPFTVILLTHGIFIRIMSYQP